MWPFRSSKPQEDVGDDDDEESVYTEEEYEEEYEYEVEVTDDEAESSDDDDDDNDSGVLVESADAVPSSEEEEAVPPPPAAEEEDKVEVATVDNDKTVVDVEEEVPVEKAEDIVQEKETTVAEIAKVDNTVQSEDGDNEEESDEGEESDEEEDETDEEEQSDAEEEEAEDTVTSIEEKHSLLALAAEHDRVDILQSIVTPEDKEVLLNNPNAPPLHVAISFGSTNATTCLLRLGANPALRPVSEHKKINGRTAWELAFGGTIVAPKEKENSPDKKEEAKATGWFSPTKINSNVIKPVDMAPSKREGIRHAFTAEALRSIGADDVERLLQLLESGMPADTDIGGNKDIAGWCREMGATQCLKAIVVEEEKPVKPTDEEKESKGEAETSETAEATVVISDAGDVSEAARGASGETGDASEEPTTTADVTRQKEAAPATPVKNEEPRVKTEESPMQSSPIVRRMSSDVNDPERLHNRLEEMHTLAVGLSTYLDNLAEEVSVCHGLLLMGNGASALASHVRSLREQQEFLRTDLEDRTDQWESTEGELGAYMRRYKVNGGDSAALFREITTKSNISKSSSFNRRLSTDDPVQLRAQLGASENKIRKLRASIADMSEESETAMKEVEKRGLSGGIQLVRKLREQIRELEFQVSEAKSGEALCRAKLQQLQQQMRKEQEESRTKAAAAPQAQQEQGGTKTEEKVAVASVPQSPLNREMADDTGVQADSVPHQQRSLTIDLSSSSKPARADSLASIEESPAPAENKSRELSSIRESDDAAAAAATASSMNDIPAAPSSAAVATGQSEALMKYQVQGGYMPLNLWNILLRIIGLGKNAVKQNVEELKKQSSTVMIV